MIILFSDYAKGFVIIGRFDVVIHAFFSTQEEKIKQKPHLSVAPAVMILGVVVAAVVFVVMIMTVAVRF